MTFVRQLGFLRQVVYVYVSNKVKVMTIPSQRILSTYGILGQNPDTILFTFQNSWDFGMCIPQNMMKYGFTVSQVGVDQFLSYS